MKKFNELKSNKKGFTLIEMIVVIVIVAILAAIAVPAVMKYIDQARETKLIAKADGIKVTYQADLAKLTAKGTGKITAADLTAAQTSAIDSSNEPDTTTITPCKADLKESDTNNGTCSTPLAADDSVNDIKSVIVDFNGTKVVIPFDGAAYVAK